MHLLIYKQCTSQNALNVVWLLGSLYEVWKRLLRRGQHWFERSVIVMEQQIQSRNCLIAPQM
jgi:gluconate kinase